MKKIFTILLVIFIGIIATVPASSQCSSFYTHTYNNYIVYPNSFNADITNNGGSTNLRIRTFQNGNGNKVIMDNPNSLSTVYYGGINDVYYSLNSCGLTVSHTPNWINYGILADNSVPNINVGTSYIPVTLSINSVDKYGWLKIGITATADTVFIYSLTIDQTGTSSIFQIGQCDVTWPNVCTSDIAEETNILNGLSIYPNPAANELFVETNGFAVEQINIYNTTGSLVSQTKQPQSKGIDVSALSNGIYIAEIKTKEGTQRFKWCKSN